MKYISTRGTTARKQSSEVLLMGLTPNGGLMLPEQYPQIDRATLDQWRTSSYPEPAFEIMSLFTTDIPADDLRDIVNRTYTEEVFGTKTTTPARTFSDDIKIQALSNGPTLAFKDMAMQLLGNAFEYILNKEGKELNILGVTSGDTDSAAEYALRGEKGVNVLILSPEGKMSVFQRAQMFSLQDANTHNITVEGMFDDCQDIVKAVQNDAESKAKYHIGTVNSINWGRIAAQVAYYFAGYFNVASSNNKKVNFCAPSGNFGNVCTGHIACQIGLPIHRLIVATNENDVLDKFFKTGTCRLRNSEYTHVTSSPSMDISKASNFERFVFDLMDRDADEIQTLWAEVAFDKGFNLEFALNKVHQQYGFVSGKSTHANCLATIKQVYERDHELIDPHIADGVKVACEVREVGEIIVCLETALAAKFEATIHEVVGEVSIPRPATSGGSENLSQRARVVPNNATAVEDIIKEALA